MRQNLTNVKEIDIKDVEHFYIVGSTTKEGLLEGKSNVKLDLKKAASGGGAGNTTSMADIRFKDTVMATLDALPYDNSGGYDLQGDEVTLRDIFNEQDIDFMESILIDVSGTTSGLRCYGYYIGNPQENVSGKLICDVGGEGDWNISIDMVDTGVHYTVNYSPTERKITWVEKEERHV